MALYLRSVSLTMTRAAARRRRLIRLSAALAGLVVLVWACGGDSPTGPRPQPDPPRPATVTVTPEMVALTALGQTGQLSAEVRDQNGNVMAGAVVTWSSSNTSVATVNASGLVTAAGNGSATITATSGSAPGSAAVTVEQAVREVAVSPAADTLVALGDTVRLAAEASDARGHAVAGAEFMWASSDTAVATVDASGLVTAAGNGSATITATSGSASGSAAVTVEQAVREVVVSPAADTLVAGGDTVRLAAEASDARGHAVAGAEFMWASSDTAVATVDASGLVTGLAAGEAEITATSSGVTGGAALAVVDPAPATVAVTPDTVTLTALGQTGQLSAEVRDQVGRPMEGVSVSWSSADTAVATVDSVGLVTAAGGGTTTIVAAAGDVSDEAVVTVMQSVRSVVVSPDVATLALGDTVRLAAEAFDETGHAVEGAEFSWSSSDGSVATVTGSGLVRGVAEGTATITAMAGSGEGTSEITVVNPDRAALVALYNATDGPNWVNSGNWLTDAPLGEWYGVRTDGEGRVVSLDLLENGLVGEIPPELGGLSRLDFLNFGENDLSGEIPPELGGLSGLGWVNLNGNDLSGPIPPELGSTNLCCLYLGGNDLSGEIPPELGGLSRMTWLDFTGNDLSGAIPPELGGLENLKWLPLGGNDLSGPIPPELGGLSNLEWLDLGGNDLTGAVPPELGSLVNLESLSLGGNRLEGVIPRSLLHLDQLRRFYMWGNEGLCVPGSAGFVSWLRGIEGRDDEESFCNAADVTVLMRLYEVAGGAGWTESAGWPGDGAVEEWHGVSADSLGRVTALDLGSNGLSGRLPATLGSMARMTELRIGGNPGLSGHLPLSLASLPLRTLHYAGTGMCAPANRSFRDWLGAIPSHEGTGGECAPLSDREILEAFYESAGGPDWINNDNWLTGRPLWEWHGVEVDGQGRVISLDLTYNGISGSIPAELGGLTSLEFLQLGGFSDLGTIPPQLADLSNLRSLILFDTDLDGTIPAELGNLANLQWLSLNGNNLEGPIPRELGRLRNLESLSLEDNELEGAIPAELGNLAALERLVIGSNDLTGPIPTAFGNLSSLRVLALDRNGLSGSLPVELGHLFGLEELHVGHNALGGTVPAEYQDLASLRVLSLSGNPRLSGALPASLTRLQSLESLVADETGLCAPSESVFVEWLNGLLSARVARCGSMPAAAYLVQAVQSRDFPVPLVAGREALLRTFVTASQDNQEPLPPVRATFHVRRSVVHVAEIPAGAGPIPTVVDEGSLAASANAVIPADAIRPGLEMTIEIDPDGTLDPGLGVARRIPETGRLAVDVRDTPRLDLTVIPFLWTSEPDSAVLEQTAGMAADPGGHELLALTRTLLPVGGLTVTAHEPVLTSSNNAYDLLDETGAIRVIEGGTGYFMGMMSGTVTGAGGVAWLGEPVNFSQSYNNVIAHELGHNMNLPHAPCGGAGGPDPAYPTPDGTIGVWGYDFDTRRLVPPTTTDIMTYCPQDWIGDYFFTKAFRYRLASEGPPRAAVAAAETRSLLLWGGADTEGELRLHPAFVVAAPSALPRSTGNHRIAGLDAGGAELFSLRFDMPETADGDGSASFAFALPVGPGWEDSLVRITLSGPSGSVTLDSDSNRPMTILRNPSTGQIRGILRDLPGPAQAAAETPRRAAGGPPPFDVLFSRGIPNAAAWRR